MYLAPRLWFSNEMDDPGLGFVAVLLPLYTPDAVYRWIVEEVLLVNIWAPRLPTSTNRGAPKVSFLPIQHFLGSFWLYELY